MKIGLLVIVAALVGIVLSGCSAGAPASVDTDKYKSDKPLQNQNTKTKQAGPGAS